MTHHNYLPAHRKTWALTQKELGQLVGLSGSSISNYERDTRKAHLNLAMRLEAVFGTPASEFFPDRYAEAERLVVERAAAFSIPLERENDVSSVRKRELLATIAKRAATHLAV